MTGPAHGAKIIRRFMIFIVLPVVLSIVGTIIGFAIYGAVKFFGG